MGPSRLSRFSVPRTSSSLFSDTGLISLAFEAQVLSDRGLANCILGSQLLAKATITPGKPVCHGVRLGNSIQDVLCEGNTDFLPIWSESAFGLEYH